MSARKSEQIALRDKFHRVYASLPLGVRREIILVINDEPITWEVVYNEIDSQTELSSTILDKLSKLGII